MVDTTRETLKVSLSGRSFTMCSKQGTLSSLNLFVVVVCMIQGDINTKLAIADLSHTNSSLKAVGTIGDYSK